MAMAGIATNLVLILRDLGTAAAIIQKSEITEREVRSVFSLNLLMGTALTISVVCLAPVAARIFSEPRLAAVLLWLSITFMMGAGTAVHQALLERNSKFRVIAAIESCASLVALAVAMWTANCGWGVNSLVAQAIVASALTSLGLILFSRRITPARIRMTEMRELFSFSGSMSGYQLTSYLFRNADSFLVGKLLGAASLGAYSLAYKLMLFPVQNISWVATRALFPVMSRAQGNQAEIIRLHQQSVSSISFFVAPLMLGLATCAEDFVKAVFSPHWTEVAPILSWLAIVGYLQVLTGTTGPVFMALGKTAKLFQLAILNAALHLAAFYFGAQEGGAVGLAQSYVAASVFMAPITFAACCRVLGWPLADLARAATPSLVGSALMCGAVRGVELFCVEMPPVTRLLWLVTAAAGFYILYSFLFQRSVLKKMLALAGWRFR